MRRKKQRKKLEIGDWEFFFFFFFVVECLSFKNSLSGFRRVFFYFVRPCWLVRQFVRVLFSSIVGGVSE